MTQETHYDAVIVGAGFAGMYMLHRLKEMGLEVRVFEAGSGVGGTWFWNRYPGARCDIPSVEYSYQFSEELQQEWEWSEKYSPQGEILSYAEHVAERFDLYPHITFNTRVAASVYDEDAARWQVTLDEGASVTARYVVMATGCLSIPNYPNIKELESFSREIYHTGRWPHDGVDFKDKRVGIIGTGSSAIQSIPIIAADATSVTIFQRTPNYSIPARNEALDPDFVADIKSRYKDYRAENWTRGFGADFRDQEIGAFEVSDDERLAEYEDRWDKGGIAFLAAFNDLVFDDDANATARDFFAGKISETVEDPALAAKLTPTSPIGCKRLCVDTDYYQTYNQDHVTLVDINDHPIEAATATGIKTSDAEYEFDMLILATGFDAMTGAITNVDIRGLDGTSLKDKWASGPRAYLGLATAGFPNLFMITGPGSPSVLSNMLPSIEQHVEWVSDCIAYMDDTRTM